MRVFIKKYDIKLYVVKKAGKEAKQQYIKYIYFN